MDASNSLDTALEKVEAIVRSGLCQKPVYPNVCKLKGYGAYQGYSYAYRLSNQKGDLLGTNSFDTLANQLGKLREHGFCSSGSRHQTPDQLERCGLLGSGSYQGYMYRHRITIGNEVVDASNSLEVVTSRVEQLRRLELCQ